MRRLLPFTALILIVTLLAGCSVATDTSIYDEEIEEFEKEIESLEADIDDLNDEIDSLNNQISQYEAMPTITPVPTDSPTPEPTPTPTPEPEYYTVGDTIIFDELEITFIDVSVQDVGNRYADYEYAVVITATVTNLSEEIHGFNMFYDTMYGPAGTQVDGAGAYFDDSIEWAGDTLSGAVLEGCFAYQYTTDGTYYLIFDDYYDEFEMRFDVVKE